METSAPPPPPPPPAIPGKVLLFRVFFFAVFIYLLYQLLLIFAPFLTALMGAATLVLIFHPPYRWFRERVGDRTNLAAGLGTIALLLVVILPFLLLTWLVAREATDMLPTIRTWLHRFQEGGASSVEAALPARVREALGRVEGFTAGWGLDIHAMFSAALDKIGDKLAQLGGRIVGNILGIVMDVVVLVIGVFFFLRDGGRMVRGVVGYIPMETVHKELLVRRLDETFSAVVRGVFITASAQGVLVGIGCALGGLDYAALLGFATAFMALIPFVGAAGIWVPATVWCFAVGDLRGAILVLIFGAIASVADNFLKPWIMGERAQIPTFLLFFGILGGLEVYGFLGIFIGPLMIGLLLTFAKIYREQFQPAPVVVATA